MKRTDRFTQTLVRTLVSILLAIAFFTFAVPEQAQAKSAAYDLPKLGNFIGGVENGDANTLRGVYIQNVMAFPVVQQPKDNARFISTNDSVVTQFSMASKAGNIGLLAHNTLAGKSFFNIAQGDQVILVYGSGRTETFVVENILSYQALPYGQYRDQQTQAISGIGGLFDAVYGGDYHVTLQTCIEREGDFEWGRLFIIAKPLGNTLVTLPVSE